MHIKKNKQNINMSILLALNVTDSILIQFTTPSNVTSITTIQVISTGATH